MLRLLLIMAAMAAMLDHVTGFYVRIHAVGYSGNKDGGSQAVIGTGTSGGRLYNKLPWYNRDSTNQIYDIRDLASTASIQFYIKPK